MPAKLSTHERRKARSGKAKHSQRYLALAKQADPNAVLEFDLLVATPDMMPIVGRLGSILKQKMPNPRAGTVSPNIGQVVKDIKGATRAEYRVEKAGIIHAPIGKASFPVENLRTNYLTIL